VKNYNFKAFEKAVKRAAKESPKGFTLGGNLEPAQGGFVIATGAKTLPSIYRRLCADTSSQVTVGGWVDPSTGKLEIESGVILKSKEPAKALAQCFGQRAIFNLKTGRENKIDPRSWIFNGQSEAVTDYKRPDLTGLTVRRLASHLQRQYRAAVDILHTVGGSHLFEKALMFYERATDWAFELSKEYGLPVDIVAHVAAALSPQNKWPTNKKDTENLIGAYAKGLPIPSVSTFDANKVKALAILQTGDTDYLGGAKVKAFAQNIQGNEQAVTLDTWAFRHAFVLPTNAPVSKYRKYHNELTEAFVIAAKVVNASPAVLQAVLWEAERAVGGMGLVDNA